MAHYCTFFCCALPQKSNLLSNIKTLSIIFSSVTSTPPLEQWFSARGPTMKLLSVQLPSSSHGGMSCAVTHPQPTSVWREATRTHRSRTAPDRTSYTMPTPVPSGAQELNHILVSPLAVRVNVRNASRKISLVLVVVLVWDVSFVCATEKRLSSLVSSESRHKECFVSRVLKWLFQMNIDLHDNLLKPLFQVQKDVEGSIIISLITIKPRSHLCSLHKQSLIMWFRLLFYKTLHFPCWTV